MLVYAILGVVMAACFVGMIICSKKQAEVPIAKPASFLLLFIVLGCAIAILVKSMGGGETKKLIANEMYYTQAAAHVLGSHLAKTFPGSNALVVVDNKDKMSEYQNARMEGLKAGFGSAINIMAVDVPDVFAREDVDGEEPTGFIPEDAAPAEGMPPADEMMMMMPIEEMMVARHWDELLDKHPNCTLIVSFIGLPRDIEEMKIWALDPEVRPKVALLQGEIHGLKNAILGGGIVAAVAYRPDAKFDELPPPKEIQAAFDKRFILLTPESIEEMQAKYNMFE